MAAGALDLELLGRYRKARGELRRALLGQLVRENTGLIKTLVDQICGRGEARRNAVRLGGCQGFRDIPWDDAFQAGCMAFMKAADQFDPRRGKISFYLLMKIRYELQCIRDRQGLVRKERDEEGADIAVIGEQAALDALGGSVGPELTADEWEGAEDLGGAVAFGLADGETSATAANDLQPGPPPKSLLEYFLEEQLHFHSAARQARVPLLARWERAAFDRIVRADPAPLLEALMSKGVRVSRVRVAWAPHPVVGFQGVRLRNAVPKTQGNGAAA